MADPALEAVLRALGARGTVVDELLAYAAPRFDPGRLDALTEYPPGDEPHVAVWLEYAAEAARDGTERCLRRRLVQLAFPIGEGMSERAEYLAAVRRGAPPPVGTTGVTFRRGHALELFVHQTAAGRLPVIVAPDRADFETLVRALTRRNEPAPIPASMGACMVAGYNNWDRVGRARQAWEAARAAGAADGDWAAAFRALRADPASYQDRFILLSDGPYSAVPASAVGMSADAWLAASRTIRLEHECAHYFTKRVFGSMQNTLHDELIADYAGIRAAAGAFRADWFLRFLGLEHFPAYRRGGRLENYRGDPPLSDGAFAILHALVVAVAEQVEQFDRAERGGQSGSGAGGVTDAGYGDPPAVAMAALACTSLAALAAADGHVRLGAAAARARAALRIAQPAGAAATDPA